MGIDLKIALERATSLARQKDHPSAKRYLKQIEQSRRLAPGVYFAVGNVYREMGDHQASEKCFRSVVRAIPSDKRGHLNLGSALRSQGKDSEALACFQRAIELDPDWPEAHFNAGNALRSLGRLGEAISAYRKSISLKPGYSDACVNLGISLHEFGDYISSVEVFSQLLESGTAEPDLAFLNRASARFKLKQYDLALEDAANVLEIDPSNAKAMAIQGAVLNDIGKPNQALEALSRALDIDPNAVEPLTNRGVVLQGLLRVSEAINDYERALQLENHVQAKWNLALARLLLGDFKLGWELYESRFGKQEFKNFFDQRPGALLPSLEAARNRVILVVWEQGLGDTLQFVRFLPELSDVASKVVLDLQPSVRSLIERLDVRLEWAYEQTTRPEIDFHVPLMSLPRLMGTSIGSIPLRSGYLRAHQSHIDKFEAILSHRLDGKKVKRIGLVWSGSLAHSGDKKRSIPLRGFLMPFADLIGFELISLQKDIREEDEATLKNSKVIDLRHHIDTFEDTAALCSLCDLVVSVDTSVCHLAGALGVPTWVLLPFAPDFRWLLSRLDSPWYSSVRLFRQPELGAWREVMSAVRSQLVQQGYCSEAV